MELGATVCLPNGEPKCHTCPLREQCCSREQGTQRQFPQKEPKKQRRVEERTVFLFRCGDRLAVCKRPEKGLLAGLWQLPDTAGHLTMAEALDMATQWGLSPQGPEMEVEKNHIFTHVEWKLRGISISCGEMSDVFQWYTMEEIREKIGLPTAYRQFLDI